MKISVVTSVFNAKDTICQTLESVEAQRHPQIEHVVQDGGSTDGTLQMLRLHGGLNMRLQSLSDSGVYDGINRGIRRASGDVIGLLHGDDRFAAPNVLALVAEALADDRLDGVYGDLQYVAHNNPHRVVRHWRAGAFSVAHLRRGWMPPHPTLYLRRAVFEEAGLYDTQYRIAGDYEAVLRFLTSGKVRLGYIPQVLVQMRLGGVSNRSFAHILRKSREDYRAIRRHGVGGVGTLIAKNVSKLPQFLPRSG